MAKDDLQSHLRDLEVSLHRPETRSDADRLDELLQDAFVEFGPSGRRYRKADILRDLPSRSPGSRVWSQDFSVVEIADGVALLTYRSADLDANGELSRHALRSSLWLRESRGWRMRFHQGTPTDAFAGNVGCVGGERRRKAHREKSE